MKRWLELWPGLALMALGCSASHGRPDLMNMDSGTEVVGGVTFRFSWGTDAPGNEQLFVEERGAFGEPGWVRVRTPDGQSLAVEPCACDADVCPGCGAVQPVIRELAPFEDVVEYVWDARAWTQQRRGARVCDVVEPLAPGEYVAEFCSQLFYPADLPETVETLDAVTCIDVPFTYPVEGGVVEHQTCFCG